MEMKTGENKMYKIIAICNHKNTSLEGQEVMLWSGKTKSQAEKWLVKLQKELGKGYSNYEIVT